MSDSEALPVTEDQARYLAESIRVLAQPQRLVILFLLRAERRIVSDIERLTGITQPMLSQYLGQLRRARLVISYRQGRQTFYALAQTDEALKAAAILDIIAPHRIEAAATFVRALSDHGEEDEEPSSAHGAMFARLL